MIKRRISAVVIIMLILSTFFSTQVFALSPSDFVVKNGVLIEYIGTDNVVNIPDNLGITAIGEDAFSGSSITSVTIPNGVTAIWGFAFDNCSSLTTVTIPNSVTILGDCAFYFCNSLTKVTIPNRITAIGNSTFYGCSSLTSVIIPNSVTTIGPFAFRDCSSLTSITIPNSVITIGYNAFSNCSRLTTVTIPNSVTTIGDNAFNGCSSLTKVTIPNSVTILDYSTFEDCSSLTSVTIPDSVTTIGRYTFGGCSSLTTVTIPNSVTIIGNCAFEGCSSLTTVTIPESVTAIGDYTFSKCSSLTSVTISNSVTTIGDSAFWECKRLTSVTIPDSVTTIESNAFRECIDLSAAYFLGNAPSMGNYVFDNTKQGFCIFYAPDKTGFTNPWIKYQTELLKQALINNVTTDKAGPQPAGTAVTVTAYAGGGTQRLYRFQVNDGKGWVKIQDYSESNTCTWTPLVAGTYQIEADVKDAASTKDFDDYETITYTISKAYDAAVIVSDTIPANMTAGQSYKVSVTLKNTGSNTWTAAANYRLGAVGNSDPFATPRQTITTGEAIGVNQQKTFTFTMKAPSTPGTYTTDWQMLKEGVAWFGQALTKQVTVTLPANDAVIVTDTIPDTMTAGQSYKVSVTLKNTGSNTWTADKYMLGGVGDSDPFAAARQTISGSSIGTNQTAIFTFVMKAPLTAGTYTTDWKMLKPGVAWFGQALTKQVTVTSHANDAVIVSDTIPANMTAGQSYKVSVTLKNTGSNTWNAATNYRLGAVGNNDPFTTARQTMTTGEAIGVNQQKTFTFTMKAPSTPGTYTTDWQMLKEGVAWFGKALTKQIKVISSQPNDAVIVSDTIPANMTAGQSYTVSVTLKNIGSNTWTAAANYRLGAVGNSDPFATPRQTITTGEAIGVNQEKTFTFTMKAPSTPGTYTTDWQMLKEGVAWFGKALSKQVTVTIP
ncbi:MAG TPA: leucine-rich repeat protein [Clostridia bacterium]|nr:leucine-rich repeat protein [Clostridia bacterium]